MDSRQGQEVVRFSFPETAHCAGCCAVKRPRDSRHKHIARIKENTGGKNSTKKSKYDMSPEPVGQKIEAHANGSQSGSSHTVKGAALDADQLGFLGWVAQGRTKKHRKGRR
jgi:hypothetical protein